MVDGRPQWREVVILCGYGLGVGLSTAACAGLAIAALTVIDRWWFQYLAIGLLVVVAASCWLTLLRLTPAVVEAAARLGARRWPMHTVVASMAAALAAVVLTAAGAVTIGLALLATAVAAAVAGPAAYAGLRLLRHRLRWP